MQARLAIATSLDAPQINSDDARTAELLRANGVVVDAAAWNDPNVVWSEFDAVLIRSVWDYHLRYHAFLAWLERLEEVGTPTINPTELLRWNSNKRYLLELAALAVDIVPTHVSAGRQLEDVLLRFGDQQVVIKPCVSASAWRTLRGRATDIDLKRQIATLARDADYLVQPFVPEIASEGEWSLLFFGGEYSHSVLKSPAQGDYRVQREFGGRTEFVLVDAESIAAARRATLAVESLGLRGAAYARIDGVRSGGRFLLMEVEMIEPFLFLAGEARASERFAAAIIGELRKLSR